MHTIGDNQYLSIAFQTTDIGLTDCWGANDALGWVSMETFETFAAFIYVGTWDVSDSLDTLKLEQATTSGGAGKKDVTGKSSSQTGVSTAAAGETAILECHAQDLDSKGGFKYVRVIVGEADNTGADNVTGFYVRGNASHAKENIASPTYSV